jgi:hypothetical protein
MILSETRGLQLFWVVRGGIGLKPRLGAELQAHRAPNDLLDTLPRTRASQEPIRYHGVAKTLGNRLGVLLDDQAACAFRCSASKRPPFFQSVKVMAAILRASVRRAISGFIPLASKPA